MKKNKRNKMKLKKRNKKERHDCSKVWWRRKFIVVKGRM